MFSGLSSYLFGKPNTDIDKNSENINRNKEGNFKEEKILTIITTNTNTNLSTNLSPVSDFVDVGLLSKETEEDDWIIIEREEEESLPRTDSEEEIPFVEIKRSSSRHPSKHRYNNSRSRSTSRTTSPTFFDGSERVSCRSYAGLPSSSSNLNNAHISSMEESWFLTPPPCFTSTGPVNMETSPFENLLIEHPSMSVYHSIRLAQGAAESFVDIDLGTEEAHSDSAIVEQSPVLNVQNARRTSLRVETFTHQHMKQGLLLKNSQKANDKKERQNVCRGALKRGNKARDYNSRGKNQRRSDMQHCKIVSGANNNRKC